MLLAESSFETQNLCEAVGDQKFWYINGIFMQADVVNGNKRLYPGAVLSEAIDTYMNDVKGNRAVGELNHPKDRLTIDPERINTLITEIRQDGSNWYGKARVINTPMGKITQALLEGGVKMGVSSRAGGEVKMNSKGIAEVQRGLSIKAIDSVYHPSAPDAFVQGLMEGQDKIWDQADKDVILLESIREDIKRANLRTLSEAKVKAFARMINSLGRSN